ncbi:MAG: hypothetical protein U1E91_02170 [Moraxella sp.]
MSVLNNGHCKNCRAWQPDLVVLAIYMRILTPLFIDGVTSSLGYACR